MVQERCCIVGSFQGVAKQEQKMKKHVDFE